MRGAEQQADRTIHRLRKTEIRTPFADALLKDLHKYYGEMFHQNNPPELVKDITDRHGIIFPTGSTLRGTTRPGSSDLDLVLMLDSQDFPPTTEAKFHSFVDVFDKSDDYHSSHITFAEWFAEKCKTNPIKSPYFDERKKYLQFRQKRVEEQRAQKGLSPLITDDSVAIYFISGDNFAYDVDEFTHNTGVISNLTAEEFDQLVSNSGSRQTNFRRSISLVDYTTGAGIAIPSLLTLTDEFAIESHPGATLQHQKKVVLALSDLEEKNPYVFARIYEVLAKNFRASVLWRGGNHNIGEEYYDELAKKYVQNSGRFPEHKVTHATDLLQAVKKQMTFPPLSAFKAKYLKTT